MRREILKVKKWLHFKKLQKRYREEDEHLASFKLNAVIQLEKALGRIAEKYARKKP